MTTADLVFHERHEVFLQACDIAERLGDCGLSEGRRELLHADLDALIERHAALSAMCVKLILPGVAVH